MRPGIKILVVTAVFTSLLAFAPNSWASTSVGIRGGFSSQPDQFLFGMQVDTSPVAKNLYIMPSAEAGFGDDAFSMSFDGDLQYRFVTSSGIRPYAGGGLSIYFINPDFGDSQTNVGMNIDGGLFFGKAGTPMFIDAKAGLTDEVPDWKFAFGVMFH
jgi:hypothetical protein